MKRNRKQSDIVKNLANSTLKSISERLIILKDSICVEDSSKGIDLQKYSFIVHRIKENVIVRYADQASESKANDEISKMTTEILSATVEKSEAHNRKNFIFDAEYVRGVLVETLVETAVNNLKVDFISNRLFELLSKPAEYDFLVQVSGIDMKSEKIQYGDVIFWKNPTAIESSMGKDVSKFVANLGDKNCCFLQIPISSNEDINTSFILACGKARFYLECLSFGGLTHWGITFTIPINLVSDSISSSIKYVYVKKGEKHQCGINTHRRHYHGQMFGYSIENLISNEIGKQILKLIESRDTKEVEKILNAVSWFSRAINEEERQIKILFLWASLESVVGREQSKDKAKQEFRGIFNVEDKELINDMYSYRNMIHGADPRSSFISSIYCNTFEVFIYLLISKKIGETYAILNRATT